MDVVAGEPHLETEVKQHSARFKLDYSQVCLHSAVLLLCNSSSGYCSMLIKQLSCCTSVCFAVFGCLNPSDLYALPF